MKHKRTTGSRLVTHILLILLTAGLMVSATGCNYLTWPVYVIFGQSRTKVKAEYTGLKGHKTAIIVATGPGIDLEYPYARTNVALAVAYVIGRHVKNTHFVEQDKVEAFQLEHLDWATIPTDEVARSLGVTRILFLDFYQFTMHEENSVHLLRGYISSAVRVYEMGNSDRAAYQTEVSLIWPEHSPVPMSDAALGQIKAQSIMKFAQRLAYKFYSHKIQNQ